MYVQCVYIHGQSGASAVNAFLRMLFALFLEERCVGVYALFIDLYMLIYILTEDLRGRIVIIARYYTHLKQRINELLIIVYYMI